MKKPSRDFATVYLGDKPQVFSGFDDMDEYDSNYKLTWEDGRCVTVPIALTIVEQFEEE